QMQTSIERYPSSLARWANAYVTQVHGIQEIAVVGNAAAERTEELLQTFIPNKVLLASEQERPDYSLLKGRGAEGETLIYVCQNFACQRPVVTVAEALDLISTS
ncbi:MAG: thioredoxin domain-containing protein, partial [Bacteroidota bacterium]